MKKVAYFNDTEFCYHWGCAATSGVIKEILSERGYALTPVTHQQVVDCKHPPMAWEEFADPQHPFLDSNRELLQVIRDNDLLVINGEGTPHGFSPPIRSLLYMAFLAKSYGKQVQIINHSCYPNDHQFLPDSPESRFYRNVYQMLDYVALREHITHERVIKMGLEAHLAFDCLPLYLKRNYRPAGPPARTRHIIIATSSSIYHEGLGPLASYLRSMMQQGYIPIALSGAAASPAVDELMFVDAMRQRLPELQHVAASSLHEWIHLLHSAAILVSGRFHYTIAAACLDTPCILFDGNTPKNIAISQDIGLPPPISYRIPDLEMQLHQRTRDAFANPPDGKRILAQWSERGMKNFAALP